MNPEDTIAAAQAAADAAKNSAEVAQEAAIAAQGFAFEAVDAVAGLAHAATDGAIDPFVFRLSIFVLAIFVGFEIITKVPPLLHTPLMSGSNAISGITIIGALLSVAAEGTLATALGFLALVFATINVVGGFLVTHRMVAMFRKKD